MSITRPGCLPTDNWVINNTLWLKETVKATIVASHWHNCLAFDPGHAMKRSGISGQVCFTQLSMIFIQGTDVQVIYQNEGGDFFNSSESHIICCIAKHDPLTSVLRRLFFSLCWKKSYHLFKGNKLYRILTIE